MPCLLDATLARYTGDAREGGRLFFHQQTRQNIINECYFIQPTILGANSTCAWHLKTATPGYCYYDYGSIWHRLDFVERSCHQQQPAQASAQRLRKVRRQKGLYDDRAESNTATGQRRPSKPALKVFSRRNASRLIHLG
jgi:glycerol-3-phosphate cytidylyltransferase-like family protein